MITGIIIVLAAFSYSQIDVSFKDVSSVEIKIATLSFSDMVKLSLDVLSGDWISAALKIISEIDLGLVFQLSNNGFFPVYVPDLSYDLSINDIFVGHGYSQVNTTINPGTTKEIDVIQNLQKNNISPAIDSIIDTNGIILVRINGTAYFKLFEQSIPVPFDSKKQISITDEIQKQINRQLEN